VIHNVCIHVSNEQPLLADLFDVPTAADAGLLCTNLRMMDGKRPVFIDSIKATFFFPYHVIRFIEIPEGALERHAPEPVAAPSAARAAQPAATPRPAGESANGRSPDDGRLPDEQRLPVPVAAAPAGEPDDLELEIDEGFLQRIRDI
jgi:hypothetical protein